jgi:hypothetical protein
MKRKAILLRFTSNDNEFYKSDLDFGLVKHFLKSAQGGCFSEKEIIEFSTKEIHKQGLLDLIDSVDYSFIYFSGHSAFLDRLIHLQLSDCLIKESELIRKNKKQWIFLDCCRTSNPSINSPEFSLPRHVNVLTENNEKDYQKWLTSVSNLEPFYLLYRTTQLNEFAFSNEFGGYGTQAFFMTLMEQLKNKKTINFESLFSIINSKLKAIQQSDYLNGNAELNNYPFKFNCCRCWTPTNN